MVRASIRVLVLATTMLTGIAASSAGELPRRGVLGVKLSGAGGIVKVEEVMNPALGALKPGDQIVAVDGKPVATTAEVIGALGRRREGDLVPLGLKRGGEAVQMDARLMAAPVPAVDGRVMELGEVTLPSGIRVRTQLARPNSDKLTRDGKAPAMMMLQGIPCITNDTFVVMKVCVGDENYNELFFSQLPQARGAPHFWIIAPDRSDAHRCHHQDKPR